MEDKSLFTNNQPQGISEGLQNFIDAMVEEIVLEGKPFDTQKKYLRKFSESEGLDYDKLEADITTFIEILDSLKTAFNKLQVKLAEEKGMQCHVSEGIVKKLIGHSSQPNHAQKAKPGVISEENEFETPRKVVPQNEKQSPASSVTVLDKYPDAKFIRDTKRWLIPKWFWWTLPIQLAGMFFSLGGLLIILWAFYHFRRKAVKNLFIEETRDKFVRISDLYKLGIYNRRTMRIILPIEYDSIDKTDSGVYLIKKGVGQGLFWKKKKTVPAEYDKISEIKPGVFVVEKAGLVGVINNGKVFIPAQYDRIAEIESGVYVVEKAGMVGAVNDGKEFIPTQYDRIEIKKDGLYSAIKGSDIKYYAKDGVVSKV